MLLPTRRPMLLSFALALAGVDAADVLRGPIIVPECADEGAGVPLDHFVSFSIEFSSLPDFAGNLSKPNTFSYNLLRNLGELSGSNPIIRVGGNTQDLAVFNSTLETAIVGIFNPNVSNDYPAEVTIGPTYFESYKTWPNITFIHGFNMGNGSSSAQDGILKSVPFACKALKDNLAYWEYGNEPDVFSYWQHRPASYNEEQYVSEWLDGTRAIHAEMEAACPDMAKSEKFKFIGPSFAGTGKNRIFNLDPVETWKAGLDADGTIGMISSHNYMDLTSPPPVTVQESLMNHTNIMISAVFQANESRQLARLPENLNPGLPFILGEHNSFAQQGRPGISNIFGAALWSVDFNLYIASQDIKRSHMHMGTNYRYQAWQPIETDRVPKGTKVPYYGNAAVAAFMKHNGSSKIQVSHLPLHSDFDAAYSAHIDGSLARLMIINLRVYNASSWNNNYTTNYTRPNRNYDFVLPKHCAGQVSVQRLMANGSDAISGATWDGFSYNYELNNGLPVRLENVTRDEVVNVESNRSMRVGLPDSSAAILNLKC